MAGWWVFWCFCASWNCDLANTKTTLTEQIVWQFSVMYKMLAMLASNCIQNKAKLVNQNLIMVSLFESEGLSDFCT